MANTAAKADEHYEVPGEVLEHILSFIPDTDTRTLATLLRVSKLLCRVVAPRVYSHVVITPESDILLDTGLPAELLDGEAEGSAGTTAEAATTGSDTLKGRFLALVKTVDVCPTRTSAGGMSEADPNNLEPGDDGEGEVADHTPEAAPTATSTPPATQPAPLHIDQLRLRLDTSVYQRPSPYATIPEYLPPPPNALVFLSAIRPRRLILHGAGFHQHLSPANHIPTTLFESLTEIIVIVTPGGMPGDNDMLSTNHGLPFILDRLCGELSKACFDIDVLRAPSVDITFILQTPRPGVRFPPIVPTPHGSMAMTMDYHPDCAPGYLHALTTSFSQRMVVMRTMGSEELRARVGVVTFVNFGMLEGFQVGMPQAAEEEMQDRLERGLRIRLRRAGLSEAHQQLKVVSMREWLSEVEGKDEGILDDDILRGWRRP